MNYSEERLDTQNLKEDYLNGLNRLIEQRESQGEKIRETQNLFDNSELHRENFRKMLGWPLCNHNGQILNTESTLLSEEDGYKIYRMSFEFLENTRIYGLFFKHNGNEKRPFSVVQHGGEGAPERISGILGTTANYNNMLMRVFNEGINVFAPQLLLWNKENYGVDFDRAAIDAKLRRVGSSITAIEVFAITKIFDYFEAQPYTKSLGMVGLSYGGMYTLFTHAADTRIKAAISCSFFNERKTYSWVDWCWQNAAYTYSDAEICCLTYPRKLWLEIGSDDDLFDSKTGKSEFERFKSLSEGKEKWVNFRVFEGNHEFYQHDDDIKAFANILWE